MSRTSTVYKVVHESPTSGVLHSGFMNNHYGESLRLDYKLDKYTHPTVGRIFAFDSLQHASDWSHSAHYPRQIWEATALDAKAPQFDLFISAPRLVAITADAFWNQDWVEVRRLLNAISAFAESTPIPDGTVICRALRLDMLVR